jgi:uncharacterized protein
MAAVHGIEDFASRSLAEIGRAAADQQMLPVERWHPPHCGQSGIRIAADGSWYYQGGRIDRSELVRLFSRVLRREADGRHVLVTPGELLDIEVEDAPFLATELVTEGERRDRTLAFRTNVGDLVVAGPLHPISIESRLAGPRPSLHVRSGLEALIARPVFYELAELAIAEAADPPGLWSGGAFFALGESG